jgi:hypothetical protein
VLRGGDLTDVVVPMLALTAIFAAMLFLTARRMRPRLD